MIEDGQDSTSYNSMSWITTELSVLVIMVHYSISVLSKHVARIPYQEAIGTLMYLAVGSRPDIAYAVQCLSKFSQNPGEAHWEAVKRVFRYLKGSRELWLSYGGLDEEVKGYADADGNMADPFFH